MIALFIALALASGCDDYGTSSDTTDDADESQTEVTADAETAADAARAAELRALLAADFPVTDGSTSAIPLDAAVRAAIFGVTYDEAEAQVTHTTSYTSYNNLLIGDCDFVFCHLLSDQQYQDAEMLNVDVEQTAIAREGFVFIVSDDNPVVSLTVEQIKGIYSGAITNWSEVGGDETPIIAYQRNNDSGSQNYMTAFMGDTPLTDAPTELRPGNMDTVVDAVAAYTSSGGSIGYSVYSYVGGMYDADGGVKILKVNGVAPDYTTISDGTYPCTGYNYAVIRSDEAEGSPARNLVKWLLTSEGQAAVATTGYYAPLEPTSGVTPTITGLDLYTQTGTGDSAAEYCAYYYTAEVPTTELDVGFEDGYAVGVRKYTFDRRRPVTGNDALNAEVARYLTETTARLTTLEFADEITEWEPEPTITIEYTFSAVNGYLSVIVNRGHKNFTGAMWDIESGKRLSFSDLFADGTDFIGTINTGVQKWLDTPGYFYDVAETLRPFVGLESDFSSFALEKVYSRSIDMSVYSLAIYFNAGDNSYFNTMQTCYCSMRGLPDCLLLNARDMSEYFTEQNHGYWAHEDVTLRSETLKEYDDTEKYSAEMRWYDITGFGGSDKINAAQYAYLASNYDETQLSWSDEAVAAALDLMADLLKINYGIENPTRDDLQRCRVIIEAEPCFFGDSYVAVSYCARAQYDDMIGYSGGVITGRHLAVYDLQTGDEVSVSVLFNDSKPDGTFYTQDGNFYVRTEGSASVTSPTALYTGRGFSMSADGVYTSYFPNFALYFEESGSSDSWFVPSDESLIWFK